MSRPRALKDDTEAQEAARAFADLDAKKARDANDAIAILERRAQSATHDVELPGGDVVPIRARLSKYAMQECGRLFSAISEAHAAGDVAKSEDASNRLIGHLLYVEGMEPDEIAAWLTENPDKFSDLDAAEIVIAFGRMLADEQERRSKLQTFRAD
jgi:hypothetical protein